MDIVEKAGLLGIESALEMVKACRTRGQAIRELEKWIEEIKERGGE